MANFHTFSISQAAVICPFDSSTWQSAALDHDSEGATVTFRCGTSLNINSSDIYSYNQSQECARSELKVLRELNDIDIRGQLHDARDQIGLLESELATDKSVINSLRDQIKVLEAGTPEEPKPIAFEIDFGKPKERDI